MNDQFDATTNAACWANGYSSYTSRDKEIGFKTSSLIFSQKTCRENNVAEDFLANSRMLRRDRERETSVGAYFSDSGLRTISLIDEEDISEQNSIGLSEGVPLTMELGEAIVRRRSIRQYTGDAIDFDYLSSLIRASAGISATSEIPFKNKDGSVHLSLHMASSGGGLYPVKLYIAALNIKQLEKGIYKYAAKQDKLIKVCDQESISVLLDAYSAPKGIISCDKANAVFLIVGSPWRSMRKYGNRGLRFVFHEAGAMTQNLHLTATALGLGSVDCASFYDDDVHKLLRMDGINQVFLSAVFLGVPGLV